MDGYAVRGADTFGASPTDPVVLKVIGEANAAESLRLITMPGAFQPEAAAGVDVVFQFSISGPGGGDWHVAIKDGLCTVDTGVHNTPTTTLKMSDEDFLSYVGGQLPAMQAYTTGKLKIEGDLMKSQLVEKLFKF
jgi:putative sterol carrier protein